MIRTIEELPIQGKRLFLRVDFNVPLKRQDGVTTVTDNTRIREALPTIQYAIKAGAKVILASHLGRPQGREPEFSLEPIAVELSKLLETEVLLSDDCVGEGIEFMAKQMKTGQVALLENLRFHPEEENNDPEFSRQLASLAEVYATDAFGTAHRKHASTYGVPKIMPLRGCGFLIQKELSFLNKLLDKPEHPFIAILGGSKVTDKIKTIENLFFQVESMLIGGAMAHAFRIARGGYQLPANAKAPKPEDVVYAMSLLEKARKHEVLILLPLDDVDTFDIGPRTIELFTQQIATAKTIFWNGPVGMFEKPEYAAGTMAIAKAVAASKALKVVGGGDTVAAINLAGVAGSIDHLSTGGGATLEFLEGRGLPGITVLQTASNKVEFEEQQRMKVEDDDA